MIGVSSFSYSGYYINSFLFFVYWFIGIRTSWSQIRSTTQLELAGVRYEVNQSISISEILKNSRLNNHGACHKNARLVTTKHHAYL